MLEATTRYEQYKLKAAINSILKPELEVSNNSPLKKFYKITKGEMLGVHSLEDTKFKINPVRVYDSQYAHVAQPTDELIALVKDIKVIIDHAISTVEQKYNMCLPDDVLETFYEKYIYYQTFTLV